MVLIFSTQANASQYVIREVKEAVERGIIIIPFRIEDIQPRSSMKFLIGIQHWMDAWVAPLEAHINVLQSTISRLMSERSTLTPVDAHIVSEITYRKWNTATQPIDVRINTKDGASMVWVPAGEFLMGRSDKEPGTYNDDTPQHPVTLDEYWIYQTPVTVAQFKRFCKDSGWKMPSPPSWEWLDFHPIVNVSWEDADAYARWAGTDLPTEAEWEKAARSADARRYPWGNDWNTKKLHCSHVCEGDVKMTAPVGSVPEGASPYGCLDMAGNVWEWCADWYAPEYYQQTHTINPTGPTVGNTRILRGGCWYSTDPASFRVTERRVGHPSSPRDGRGFRCVLHSTAP